MLYFKGDFWVKRETEKHFLKACPRRQTPIQLSAALLARKMPGRLNRDRICRLNDVLSSSSRLFRSEELLTTIHDSLELSAMTRLPGAALRRGRERNALRQRKIPLSSTTIRRSRLYRRTFVAREIFYVASPDVICFSFNCLCIRTESFEVFFF